jgi:hypothetical protein
MVLDCAEFITAALHAGPFFIRAYGSRRSNKNPGIAAGVLHS